MRNGDEKRFHSLTAQRSPGPIRYRSGNYQWKFLSGFFKNFRNGEERRLCIQRVEDGFNQQKIDTSFDQGFCLVEITLFELIERDGAESGIVYIWRH